MVTHYSGLGPVVQSVVSLTSSLRVISLTVLADSIYNILKFFAEKCEYCKSYSHFFSKKFQHNCVSLDVNFNESLSNDVVSFEQLGPGFFYGDATGYLVSNWMGDPTYKATTLLSREPVRVVLFDSVLRQDDVNCMHRLLAQEFASLAFSADFEEEVKR